MEEVNNSFRTCSARAGHLLPVLPPALAGLEELATDLRWTWSHTADKLWQQIDSELWETTGNPYVMLQNISRHRLNELAANASFCQELQHILTERESYLARCGWYGETYPDASDLKIAFFSMEYGFGSALPFYAGGLGILSGDVLKTASDLCIPIVGVGLLYYQGYLRQMIDADNRQHEIHTTYQPSMLPVAPVYTPQGDWLQVSIDLPGRSLRLRVWQAQVGSVSLFLLDSNHPLNSPTDQGITSQLYSGNYQLRLLQELVLGIGGWRALEAMGQNIDVCHLNEGHAAFVILERTSSLMQQHDLDFQSALWINRAGTLFTTHTPVDSAFDTYDTALISQYLTPLTERLQIGLDELLDLGRKNPGDNDEAFNLAWFAMRCSLNTNAVSHKHGETSRYLFRELYPHWPLGDIPVSHITNGIHMPSWDSSWADKLWTETAGKERWRGSIETLSNTIEKISDKQLWDMRTEERRDLVEHVRKRHALGQSQRGASAAIVSRAARILDPNMLTLGFARRFTKYKRPLLLLMDKDRLCRLLNDPLHPVQILIAGKAHPQDELGKLSVQAWASFAQSPEASGRVVFLEDYDIPLAREMVQGVDVWINTPRLPWEACGTSGMKVLVNGGLNLSVLDGWWAKAYDPAYGWAIEGASDADADTSRALFELLETTVIPTFYQRNDEGIPEAWVRMIRASMAELAPRFCSNRMLKEYIERFYLPSSHYYRSRLANNGELGRQLQAWHQSLQQYWPELHWGEKRVINQAEGFCIEVDLYLDGLSPELIEVQLYADATAQHSAECFDMHLEASKPGAIESYIYRRELITDRPAEDFTPRVVAHSDNALIPQENHLIYWWQERP